MAADERFSISRVILFINLVIAVNCMRIGNKTYVEVNGFSACIRRLNGTHQVGCSSEIKGNVGILHYVSNQDDMDWLINNGPHQPYAVLLNSNDFNVDNVRKLRDSGKINGILVVYTINNKTVTPLPTEGFSPDETCPEDQYGMYHNNSNYSSCKQMKWNPKGNSLFFQDFEFPIFVLNNQTEIDFLITECYEKFNQPTSNGTTAREYPLCAVQLKDRMSGAKNSETCIRRTNTATNLNPDTYCDPLGDKNVVATFKGIGSNEEYPDNSVIMASARLDSFSLFENVYPSADNHVSGVVGLLAAAEALGQHRSSFKNDSKDILFTFLNGEAFDYIGSSRVIYEMEQGKFPAEPLADKTTLHVVSLNHLESIFEVNQLANRDDRKLWIHTDPLSQSDADITRKIDEMIASIKDVSNITEAVNLSQPLPPASAQRFLMKKKIPAVVITDHKGSFTNKYYNSRFDVARAISAEAPPNTNDRYNYVTDQVKNLTIAATMIAKSLFKMANNEDPPESLMADEMSVAHLLYCFLDSRQCELFREIIGSQDNSELDESSQPYPFYVGVDGNDNHVTILVKRLLSRYLGSPVDGATSDSCKQPDNNQVYQYTWMQGPLINGTRRGMCMKSTVITTLAKSPAFDIDDYDWSSTQYSTWTESSWQGDAQMMKIFLVPSKKMEVAILCTGIVILLLSLGLTFTINKKAPILFGIDLQPQEN